MSERLVEGEKLLIEVAGPHECGTMMMVLAEATYIGRDNLGGKICDVFEFDRPLTCTCGMDITYWARPADSIEMDAEFWEVALVDVEI